MTAIQALARKDSLESFGNASGVVPPFSIARLTPKNLKLPRPSLFTHLHTKEEFAEAANEWIQLVQ